MSAKPDPSPDDLLVHASRAVGATRIAAGALLRGESPLDPHLRIVAGPGEGRVLPLGSSQTVGRGRDADLRLDDPAASRIHLRLSRVDGRFLATDLDSKNGLRVNDRPARVAQPLEVGDELAIGATRLRLEPGLLDRASTPSGPASPTESPAGSVVGPRAEEAVGSTDAPAGATSRCGPLLAGAAALFALAAALLALP